MTETLQLKGTLIGHSGWVTQIATNPKYPDMILSSSRGMNFSDRHNLKTENCFSFRRQDFDRLALVARSQQLWSPTEASLWPLALHQRRRLVIGR
jgi:hypothetical protein